MFRPSPVRVPPAMEARLGDYDRAYQERIAYRAQQYFEELPLKGRRVLDVGAGRGLFSVWMHQVCGAREVVALEPSAGVGGHGDFASKIEQVFGGTEGLILEQNTLQGYAPAPGSFDAAVLINSINHVDEVSEPLDKPSAARDRFLDVFRQLHDLLAPGGDLMIAELARYPLERYTSKLGIPALFTKGIEYEVHQQPSTWGQIARDVGFVGVRWRPMVSKSLARLGPLAKNTVVNMATNANFVLQARKDG